MYLLWRTTENIKTNKKSRKLLHFVKKRKSVSLLHIIITFLLHERTENFYNYKNFVSTIEFKL